jgi:uncharacterized protein (TIGR03663 family)
MNRAVVIILAVMLAGALLRLPDLANRPMHTDEAVHAVKFGTLLETGDYRYDPFEYHGPTLNYLTLIPAWLSGAHTYSALQEWHLRIVPAVCGIFLIALFLLFDRERSQWAIWAAAFAALSPAMVFYSRYYIQEMLLVFFTLAFVAGVYRYLQERKVLWAMLAGIAAGLMYATKETSIITFGVLAISGGVVVVLRRGQGLAAAMPNAKHILAMAGSAIVVIVIFFSSFGRHPEGVVDAFAMLPTYFGRAGTDGPHRHPWLFYAQMLGWSRGSDGRLWTEAGILLFAVAGFTRTWKERRMLADAEVAFRITAVIATLLMIVIISVMPYKTPWVVLSALLGLIIMAGAGIESFIAGTDRMRQIRLVLVAGILLHLGWEAYAASYTHADDPGNPYVYAQPRQDVVEIGKTVTALARASESPISVCVCYQDGEYWPLPWYLRTIAQTGWWNAVPDTLPRADVVAVSPELEPALTKALYERAAPGERALYVTLFTRPAYVRPGREIRVYTTLALREQSERRGKP